jgi:hypothetical protein
MANLSQELEDALWRDAYGIAWVGASNPAGVANTLAKRAAEVSRAAGTRAACEHHALRAIAGHLAFLFGNGLGPDDKILTEVQVNARRLGLIT